MKNEMYNLGEEKGRGGSALTSAGCTRAKPRLLGHLLSEHRGLSAACHWAKGRRSSRSWLSTSWKQRCRQRAETWSSWLARPLALAKCWWLAGTKCWASSGRWRPRAKHKWRGWPFRNRKETSVYAVCCFFFSCTRICLETNVVKYASKVWEPNTQYPLSFVSTSNKYYLSCNRNCTLTCIQC